MLDLGEIDRAIAELEAGRTTFTSCSKLADLYAVRNNLGRQPDKRIYEPEAQRISAYSFAASPASADETGVDARPNGGSDFLRTVGEKELQKAWAILDELMDSLHIVNARLYENIMRKLRSL